MSRPAITHESKDGTVVITFQQERINEFPMADQLRGDLREVLDGVEFTRMVLDLHKVQYVISEIFCVLIQLSKEARARRARVVACNLNPFLREIYTTIRLDSQIPVCETLEDALKT